MFCKWCGKTIQITDKNCPSCGRETPPMSDCGGFYNLKTPGTEIPQGGERGPTVVMNCPVIEKLESKYIRDRKADKAHHKLTVVFFGILAVLVVLSLVLGVLTIVKVGAVTGQISQMQKDVAAIEELVLEVQQTVETPHVPSTIVIPEETIPAETEPVDETEAITVAEETNEQGETVFKVQYQNEIELFADGEITYIWQYSKEADIWQNVDKEQFQLDEDGISVFTCTEDFLERIDAREQRIELRCVVQCENKAGDTMEICVGGMYLGEEMPEVVIDENVVPEVTEENNSKE